MTTALESNISRARLLAMPEVRHALERYVRHRVPPADVDDVVQTTLAEALTANGLPEEPAALQRWLKGVAKHKAVDLYRGRRRELLSDTEIHDAAGEEASHSARDLLRWATNELPHGPTERVTFDWMLREGSGDKLENIAREQGVPATRVRQRVSRMRRFFRERWAAQIATALVLALLVGGILWMQRDQGSGHAPEIAKEPVEPNPAPRLRERAFEACEESRWQRCLDLLDEAKQHDAAGNLTPKVERARRAAGEALKPQQQPLQSPQSVPPQNLQEQLRDSTKGAPRQRFFDKGGKPQPIQPAPKGKGERPSPKESVTPSNKLYPSDKTERTPDQVESTKMPRPARQKATPSPPNAPMQNPDEMPTLQRQDLKK